MPKLHFTGSVLPNAFNISIDLDPQARFDLPELDLQMSFTVYIRNSLVDVECEVNRFPEDEFFFHLIVRAIDLAQASIDMVAFATGCGFSIVIDTLVRPDGSRSPLQAINPLLSGLCTAFRVNTSDPQDHADTQALYKIVLTDHSLFMALTDLNLAITRPHYAAINCARAIETLRHLIAPGVPRKHGWPLLRSSLHIEVQYLEYVTGHSVAGRHGDHATRSVEVDGEILKRSWIIMNRFLEFRKRANQPLPIAEFPTLM